MNKVISSSAKDSHFVQDDPLRRQNRYPIGGKSLREYAFGVPTVCWVMAQTEEERAQVSASSFSAVAVQEAVNAGPDMRFLQSEHNDNEVRVLEDRVQLLIL
jgi:hypothetical protein